jgi:hypothetical protein
MSRQGVVGTGTVEAKFRSGKMAQGDIKGMFDYLGQPIKRYTGYNRSILDQFQVKDYCLLEVFFPHVAKDFIADANVHQIQKYEGTKKHPFIYLVKTYNGWFRLATKLESNAFVIRREEKTKRGN